MQAKTERFEMRFDQETLDRIDGWRGAQGDMPTRAEAIRRLIAEGLGAQGSKQIRFSDGEKLIITMLADLSKATGVRGEINPDFVTDVIYRGHYWALKWQLSGLFHDSIDTDQEIKDVVNILDMWSFIESGYKKLSTDDQAFIAKEVPHGGNEPQFLGFDGNNETSHMAIAEFLIEKMGRFANFKGRSLNSHMPTLYGYRAMARRFETMRPHLVGRGLSAPQIIELLKQDY